MLRFCCLPLLLLLLLFQSAAPAQAEIYTWVDVNGTITFRDTPPPAGVEATVVKTAPLNVVKTPARVSGHSPSQAPPVATQPRRVLAEVELFTTNWCGYCRKARAYLQQQGVSYREYDVEKDRAAAQRKQQLGGSGVPFAIINGQKILGFDPEAYASALGIR